MTKNTITAQEYISPACKTVTLSARRSYLQEASPLSMMLTVGTDDAEEDDYGEF